MRAGTENSRLPHKEWVRRIYEAVGSNVLWGASLWTRHRVEYEPISNRRKINNDNNNINRLGPRLQQPLRYSKRRRGGWIRNQSGLKRDSGACGAQPTGPLGVNSEGTGEGKVKGTQESSDTSELQSSQNPEHQAQSEPGSQTSPRQCPS